MQNIIDNIRYKNSVCISKEELKYFEKSPIDHYAIIKRRLTESLVDLIYDNFSFKTEEIPGERILITQELIIMKVEDLCTILNEMRHMSATVAKGVDDLYNYEYCKKIDYE